MEQKKIDRINELAHKKKTVGLTEAELAEQKALREEYLSEFRASFKAQLDHTSIQYPDGHKEALHQVHAEKPISELEKEEEEKEEVCAAKEAKVDEQP